MTTLTTALGFGLSEPAQFRFHILLLLYRSGWSMVREAFPNLSRPTVYRWKKAYENAGKKLNALIPKRTRPKRTRRMQTPLPILALIRSLRETYPRMGKAKLKLFVDVFAREQRLPTLSVSTIGKVIKRNSLFFGGSLRKRKQDGRAKQRIRVCPKAETVPPGYLQVDGFKFFYLNRYFCFLTAVEIVTRQAFVCLVPRLSSKQAATFLRDIISQTRVPIHTIQTDNGSEFAKYFAKAIQEFGLTHLFSYPKHPKTNGYVERFNWTVQDEFLLPDEDLLLHEGEFHQKLAEWVVYYNQKRPHQSLGYLTPYQYQEQKGLCLKSM